MMSGLINTLFHRFPQLAGLLFLILSQSAAIAQPLASMEWNATTLELSVDAKEADLRKLLRELSQRANFKLWVSDTLVSTPLTIEMASKPLAQAIKQLLNRYNYAVSTDDEKRITALYVLAATDAPPVNFELNVDNQQQKAIDQVLASEVLPEQMKTAILFQSMNNSTENRQAILAQKNQAVARLIERIEQVGFARPETIQQLRDKLGQAANHIRNNAAPVPIIRGDIHENQ